MNRTLTSMILAGAMALALPAAAQPDGQKRAQVRQHITDFAMQQITQQLALDAADGAALPRGRRQVRAADRRAAQGGRHGDAELNAQLAAAQPDEAQARRSSPTPSSTTAPRCRRSSSSARRRIGAC